MIRSFNSIEGLFAAMEESRRLLAAAITPEQRNLRTGDWFVYTGSSRPIFGCLTGTTYDEDREYENNPEAISKFARVFCSFSGIRGALDGVPLARMQGISIEDAERLCRAMFRGDLPDFPVWDSEGNRMESWREAPQHR